jgi:hypothetical protein
MPESSAIRVLEQSPGRLVFYEPPYWPFAIGFVAAGVLIAALLFLFMWSLQVRTGVRFIGCILALPFLFFGIKAWTSHSLVEFSAADGAVAIRQTQFLIAGSPRTIPLADVVRAVELHARRSFAVGLLLRTGENVPITGYGDQGGKPLMIQSINQFLQATR